MIKEPLKGKTHWINLDGNDTDVWIEKPLEGLDNDITPFCFNDNIKSAVEWLKIKQAYNFSSLRKLMIKTLKVHGCNQQIIGDVLDLIKTNYNNQKHNRKEAFEDVV